MYFDGFQNINPNLPRQDIEEGAEFPVDYETGGLFRHRSYGLCVFCHDSVWRKVIEQ